MKSIDKEMLAAWMDNYNDNDDTDLETIKNHYVGSFENVTDFGFHIATEFVFSNDTNETIRNYFNYEFFGKDLLLSGEYFESGSHYFRSL